MRRTIVALAGVAIATALIFGPGRSLIPGSARVQLPDASHGDHSEPAVASAPAAAQPAAFIPGPSAARLAVTASPAAKQALGYVLAAHIAGPDGKALNETTVSYYETVDLLGTREMYIGQASTDSQGDATFYYLPARLGTHEIVARTGGKGQVTRNETRMTLDARVAAAKYRSEPAPLSKFTDLIPYAVGALVLSVWALIAFAFLGTARGVFVGGRDRIQKKGDIA
jgi:hypothetical protein